MAVKSWFALVAIAIGAVGLGLDFQAIAGTMVAGPLNPVPRSLPNMLVYYWTFLTNLSNLGIILVYVSDFTGWRGVGWFRRPVTRAGLAGIVMLVMGFYHFMLAPTLHGATSYHPFVEFGNRTLTGVLIVVAVAVLVLAGFDRTRSSAYRALA